MREHLKKFLIVSLVLILIGCGKKNADKDYIARVENEYLLKSDLAGLDSNFVKSYIDAWINNNLLYIEAIEQGYKANDKIERMVSEFRKSLIIKNFIQNEILHKAMKISEQEVEEFYQKHQDEFILDRPFVKIGYVKFSSRADAGSLRSKILREKNFKSAVEGLSKEQGIVEIVPERYYDQFSIPSGELWRVAWSLNKNEISFPVRVGDNYFLIFLYEKREAGSKADFELVAEDVRERAIVEKQNLLLDSLITRLKRKYYYEVKW
ncbi:PPIC-type PPIASE domain-containing protein [Candidatus Kryptobacter tengchongensis]|uniref:PPIC-type PPIASE domain-containing protein n=1 Tax=Kryptobacter tengchongensis TaxID=1643429 RepID=A0A656DD63_KRYT1|nr:peptidylprolyl isomerase [Candidatus Kryptobacter tengchongensis]CUS96049.1 PPIC-type PPIASE domain-containing protein [Candidatus Kryptobacter tengchongensis]CUU06331.1 PPIC-type PPIASE domain-containing protein [Candidatus Kryptobacter tengchongensis]